MRVNMIYNDNIKIFNNIKRHLEFKDDRLGATKTSSQLCITNSNLNNNSGSKCKRGSNTFQRKRELCQHNEGLIMERKVCL